MNTMKEQLGNLNRKMESPKKTQIKILESQNKIYKLKFSLGRFNIKWRHRKEKSVNLKMWQ